MVEYNSARLDNEENFVFKPFIMAQKTFFEFVLPSGLNQSNRKKGMFVFMSIRKCVKKIFHLTTTRVLTKIYP